MAKAKNTATFFGGRPWRFIVAVMTVAVTVVLITMMLWRPWTGFSSDARSTEVAGVASAQQLLCPGPILRSGAIEQDRSKLSVLSGVNVNGGIVGDSETPAPTTLEIMQVDVNGPQFYRLEAGAAQTMALSASVDLNNDQIRGYAMAACAEPQMESWLMGGSGQVGTTEILTLANPGEVSSVVSIMAYGIEGSFVPAAARQLIVPPSSVLAVSLSALTETETKPVIRVTAEQAPVVALLQSSTVQGLMPVGLEWSETLPAPANKAVISGAMLQSHDDGEAASLAVRVLAPTQSGTVKVRVFDTAGIAVSEVEAPVSAEVPLEVTAAAPGSGRYSIVIESDTAIVAAAKDNWDTADAHDYVWWPSLPLLLADTSVAVPSGASLNLFNPGATELQLEVNGLSHTIAAEGTLSLSELPSSAITVSVPDAAGAASGFYASVSQTSAARAGAFAVWPSLTQQPALLVFPQ